MAMENFNLAALVAIIKKRLLLIASIIVPTFAISFYLSGRIINGIKQDLLPGEAKIIAQTMLETVMVKLQISLVLTAVVALPAVSALILRYYRIKILRLSLFPWLLAALILFLIGFGFTYLLLLPTAIGVLTSLTLEAGVLAYYSIAQFVLFIFLTTIIFSLLFELPLAVSWLTINNLVSEETLKEKRKYVYVGILVLAALITADPTIVSQMLLSIPLIFLYEASIVVSSFIKKRQRK